MPDLNVFKIEGKPIEKLIEVISKGIGTIYKPRAIRKEAEAKAFEIEIIERAKSKALAEGKEIEAESIERIQDRLVHKELRRQENIDNVTQIAAQQLSQEETVSEEPVDEDWTTRFFNIVEDISDEEMQKLWGRILAGEVKQPKSYSLRTLELLKNLSKREADVFTKASNLVITSIGGSSFMFRGKENNFIEKYNLNFEDRLLLTETGLLQAESNISRALPVNTSDNLIWFESGNYLIKALKKANTEENRIEIYRFTKIGEELLNLLKPNPSYDYLKDFYLRIQEFGIDVEYAFISKKNNDGTITHSQPWLKFM
jgi:uncharacterized repeat protein (TIGR03899 family)